MDWNARCTTILELVSSHYKTHVVNSFTGILKVSTFGMDGNIFINSKFSSWLLTISSNKFHSLNFILVINICNRITIFKWVFNQTINFQFRNGTIDAQEFAALWKYIQDWKACFERWTALFKIAYHRHLFIISKHNCNSPVWYIIAVLDYKYVNRYCSVFPAPVPYLYVPLAESTCTLTALHHRLLVIGTCDLILYLDIALEKDTYVHFVFKAEIYSSLW